jgi:hypothetical protein
MEQGKREANGTIKVDEYVYNNRRAFLFTAECCDHFNMLYDDSCKVICAASGGFTGQGDGKCDDFTKAAKFIKLIWKDSTQ